MAQDFERALCAAGKAVEAVYYEGGRHNGIFDSPDQYRDELPRILAFLRQHAKREYVLVKAADRGFRRNPGRSPNN